MLHRTANALTRHPTDQNDRQSQFVRACCAMSSLHARATHHRAIYSCHACIVKGSHSMAGNNDCTDDGNGPAEASFKAPLATALPTRHPSDTVWFRMGSSSPIVLDNGAVAFSIGTTTSGRTNCDSRCLARCHRQPHRGSGHLCCGCRCIHSPLNSDGPPSTCDTVSDVHIWSSSPRCTLLM